MTISLLGSLDEIETLPDFLNQVQRKIGGQGRIRRVWGWLFEPMKIKVPLEITALFILTIGAFYLYNKSPELSRGVGILPPLENLQVAQDKPQEKVTEKKPGSEESDTMAKVAPTLAAKQEAQPRLPEASDERLRQAREGAVAGAVQPEVQASLPRPSEASREAGNDAVALRRRPEILEVVAEDVTLYEKSVKVLLEEVEGRVSSEERSSGPGLLLTIELPQSRQAEFLAALKVAVIPGAKVSPLRQGAAGGARDKAKGDLQPMDALKASEKGAQKEAAAPALESSRRIDEPMVRLQLRILPKK
jgi:hypothetical protein